MKLKNNVIDFNKIKQLVRSRYKPTISNIVIILLQKLQMSYPTLPVKQKARVRKIINNIITSTITNS